MADGILVVVSGFSGSGKGTLMKKLLSEYDEYALSVSATTRAPRTGEVEGREYFFKSKEDFEKLIEKTPFRFFSNLITIKNGAIDSFKEYQNHAITPQSFIYLGRLEEYKGIKELISAFSQIAPEFPSATLHIYGTGSLAHYCKNHQTAQIVYYGFTNQPLEKIASNEIFVLASHIEGLSLSLIDATMLGKPIVATNIDGNPEIVQHEKNGFLVPARDTRSLIEVFRKLLLNPGLIKSFSQASRKKYLKEFDFSKTIKEQLIPIIEGGNHV